MRAMRSRPGAAIAVMGTGVALTVTPGARAADLQFFSSEPLAGDCRGEATLAKYKGSNVYHAGGNATCPGSGYTMLVQMTNQPASGPSQVVYRDERPVQRNSAGQYRLVLSGTNSTAGTHQTCVIIAKKSFFLGFPPTVAGSGCSQYYK